MPRVKRLHALSHYEPIRRFANTKVTGENYLELAFGFMTPRWMLGIEIAVLAKRQYQAGVLPEQKEAELRRLKAEGVRISHPFGVHRAISQGKYVPEPQHDVWDVLKGCYDLAGERIDTGSVAALRSLLHGALGRFIEGGESVLRDGKDQGTDFTIRGRKPFSNPEFVRADDGTFDFLSNDLQDIWYQWLSDLLACAKAGQSRKVQRGGHETILPFRPLCRCPAGRLPHFFFRAGGPRQVTCGSRKCVERHANSKKKRPALAKSSP